MTKTLTNQLFIMLAIVALTFSFTTFAFANEDDDSMNDDDSSVTTDDDSMDDEDIDVDESEDTNESDDEDTVSSKDEKRCDASSPEKMKDCRTDKIGKMEKMHKKCAVDVLKAGDEKKKFCRDGEWKEKKEARLNDIMEGFIKAGDLTDEEATAVRSEVEALIRQLIALMLKSRLGA